jgi:hypothetical protein
MIQNLTIKNCPIICAKAAIKLKLITLKYCPLIPLNKNKNKRLNTEPLRLKKNVGPRNVPKIMLTINTRMRDTHKAVEKLNFIIVNRIIILAIPGLTPGIGLGKKNSINDKAIAIAANLATL